MPSTKPLDAPRPTAGGTSDSEGLLPSYIDMAPTIHQTTSFT